MKSRILKTCLDVLEAVAQTAVIGCASLALLLILSLLFYSCSKAPEFKPVKADHGSIDAKFRTITNDNGRVTAVSKVNKNFMLIEPLMPDFSSATTQHMRCRLYIGDASSPNLITIDFDTGRVRYKGTADKAARDFWDAVVTAFPEFRQRIIAQYELSEARHE